MPELLLSILDGGGAPISDSAAPTADLKVSATLSDPEQRADYITEIQLDGACKSSGTLNATSPSMTTDVKAGTGFGEWTAQAKGPNNVTINAVPMTLRVMGGDDPAPSATTPAVFDKKLAKAAMGIAMVAFLVFVAVIAVWRGNDEPEWALSFSLLVLGGALASAGTALAAIEVRSVLADPADAAKPSGVPRGLTGEDASKIIESVSKLKGAIAVLLFAAVCVLSAAWVGQAAAGNLDTSDTNTSVDDSTTDTTPATTLDVGTEDRSPDPGTSDQ